MSGTELGEGPTASTTEVNDEAQVERDDAIADEMNDDTGSTGVDQADRHSAPADVNDDGGDPGSGTHDASVEEAHPLSGSGEPAEGAEDAVQSGAADSSPNDSLVEDVTEGAVSEPVVVVEGITTSPADTSEQDDSTITGVDLVGSNSPPQDLSSESISASKSSSKSDSSPRDGLIGDKKDRLVVKIEDEDGTRRDVAVEVVRLNPAKPFIGGFVDRRTGVEYHNATAQTRPNYKQKSNTTKYTRATQTSKIVNRSVQTTSDAATQMPRPGYWFSDDDNVKVIIPGKYVTYDEIQATRMEAILRIQRCFRFYKERERIKLLKKEKAQYEQWQKEDAEKRIRDREERFTREYEKRLKPVTKEDFDKLYAALEKWRREHVEEIDETLGGSDRKAALYGLLEKETKLVAAIDVHKNKARQGNEEKSVQRYLEKTAAPKRWKAFDGRVTNMDTDNSIRARQLKELYEEVVAPIETYDKRLEVLLLLKCTVKEHNCKLTRDIVEQVDRETECITRGFRDNMMENMRKIIATLFLQYIKNPLFNPQAERFNRAPLDSTKLRHNVFHCPSCGRYLPSTDFEINTHSRAMGRCRKCMALDNIARAREDLAYYKYLLENLRVRETKHDDNAKVAFLLQPADIRYLVDIVWLRQSVLSKDNDPFELALVRWNNQAEWTPWNSILLTIEEAEMHEQVGDLEGHYNDGFRHRIQRRHVEALKHFQGVPGLSSYLSKNKAHIGGGGPRVSQHSMEVT